MKSSLIRSIKTPLFLYFLLPSFYILFGTIYALPYASLNIISFFTLYLFILLNQIIESSFENYFVQKMSNPFRKLWTLELLIGLCLLYFVFTHSLVAALLLACYVLMVQSKYLFAHYDLEILSILLVTVFKSFLLNIFGFYIHTGFLSISLSIYFIPLVIPFFLYEYYNWNKSLSKKKKTFSVVLIYLIALLFLWSVFSWWSLFLLVSSISSAVFIRNNGKRSVLYFSSIFSLNYFILFLVFTMFQL